MKIFKSDKIKLILNDGVLDIFQGYIQNTPSKNEAGGILLGQIKDDYIYIIRSTIPNKFDKATRYSFTRNKEMAQIIADFEYINSDQRTIYIGEWHTHPEDMPSPSGQDMRMIEEQYKKGKNLYPFIFLIIQGRVGLFVSVYNGNELVKMVEK